MATLNTNAEKAYEKGLKPLLQQEVSKFKPLVTVKNFSTAEEWYMNQIGSTSVSEVADLTAATVLANTTTARRQITKSNYYYHELVLDDHLNDMSFDPKSDLVQNIIKAFKRQMDATIVAAATAAANTGKNGGTSTTFPAGQIIDSAAAAGFTYAKVLEAVKLYNTNDFTGERLACVIGPEQVEELFNIKEFVNSDYTRLQATPIAPGFLGGYLGSMNVGVIIDFYTYGTLTVPASDQRDCLLFPKDGIGLGVGMEPTVKFVTRGDLNSQLQISVGSIFGASRLDEEKVVAIRCDES